VDPVDPNSDLDLDPQHCDWLILRLYTVGIFSDKNYVNCVEALKLISPIFAECGV
jgi:hypothetical protein